MNYPINGDYEPCSDTSISSQATALIMGFPTDWFSPLCQPTPQEESEVDTSQEEQSLQDKQRSRSDESSISIPCLVKQPDRPELKGLIREDKGDRFDVYIPDSDLTITLSKLFVYPDFSKSVGQLDKNPSKDLSKSKNIQRKTRRRKGEGNGYIYYRTVTRNGKKYRQAYYQWREDGKQRTKYIRGKLLSRVEEAESSKLPVSDILVLLGGIDKCSFHKSNTSIAPIQEKAIDVNNECSSKIIPPSKNIQRKIRRQKGEGSGAIFYRTVTRNGRDYQEAYYHWRSNGKQRTKYIPKKLLARVEEAESLKLPVEDILVLLVGTDKCSRKKSDTSIISTDAKVIDSSDECSRKTIPTSKKRRQKGYGSGWIQCKPIKRSGKEYQQYWYCYEEWQSGERLVKKSKYIPKRLVQKVERMNDEKVSVEEILKVLTNKNKRS